MSTYKKATAAIATYLQQIEENTHIARYHLFGNGAVNALEEKLSNYYQVKHALCVDSATNAFLYLALAAGLRNSEIISTPLSYGATISGALYLRNKFHFADIDNTLNISPTSVEKIINRYPSVKAVYGVDFAGIPHDMFRIREICDNYGIWYFADAAQSLGATINNISASSLAHALVVSFSPGKSICCGEGGCILTNDTNLYKKLIIITQHPYRIKKEVDLQSSSELGLNGRIHPLAAIIGNAIFEESLEKLQSKQAENLELYQILEKYSCKIPFRLTENKLIPSFYHMPLIIDEIKDFSEKITFNNKKYIVIPASFEILPLQLLRIKQKRAIKSNNVSNTTQIQKKLYTLQIQKTTN